jgi:hypothetical protein
MSNEDFKNILLIIVLAPIVLVILLFGFRGIKQPEVFKSDGYAYNVKQEAYSDSVNCKVLAQ